MMLLIHLFFTIAYVHIILLGTYHQTSWIDNFFEQKYLYELYQLIPIGGDLLLIGLFVFLMIFFVFHYYFYKKFSPRYRVAIASKTIKRIRKLNLSNPEILSYLRKIDPFVFEEMLLTLLKENGYKIKRNKRYTGDGGSDGQVWLNGVHYHVQAKRYKSHISKQHMVEFIELTKREKSKGLFIHTGRTGKATKSLADEYRIEIISGDALCHLVKKKNQH